MRLRSDRKGPWYAACMMFLYSFALTVALAASAPVWGWRMLRQGRYRDGLRQRLGDVPPRLAAAVKGRQVVWLHAVSVGELIAATRLIAELQAALPDHILVVSTTTPTGQQVARERFDVDRVFFFPVDFAFAVRAYLRVLQPRLVILMESELWPRFLVECDVAGVPVAVVNARVSDRSLPRYMALRLLWKSLLQRVTLLLAQSEEDARRWIAIGAAESQVRCVGNLKYDVPDSVETPLANLIRRHLPNGAKVLVSGSTHDGEESLLLDCVPQLTKNQQVMILAPRHPQRVAQVEQLAADRNLRTLRLSQWRLSPEAMPLGAVLLIDTVGELSALYALASVAFVGGSLVARGGQNPLEPARFGVPVVMGESFENFRDVVAAMQAAGAITIVSAETLSATLSDLMSRDPSTDLQRRSRGLLEQHAGATARTVASLLPLLKERG
ncbi:MAG: 3-deoxy-D-manno-octulosonic acid transferase [Janthinobacterium lividum]